MHLKIKLVIAVILLVFSGCEKSGSGNDTVGPLLIPQEVKDYTLFQPGTYWVYIDSVSGRVDSLYVYETTHSFDTLTLPHHAERVYEIYVVKAHSDMDGYNYYFEVNTTYSANDNSKFMVFMEKLKPGDYAGRTILFIHKAFVGQDLPYLNSHIIVQEIYKNLSLNGVKYKDVLQIYHDLSAVEVSNNVTNFIAKNYGLVRKEYLDSNQVWELARSNIIQ